jgi:hypothetical protein
MPNVSIISNIENVLKTLDSVSKEIKSKVIKMSVNDTLKVSTTAAIKSIINEGYNMSKPQIKGAIKKKFARDNKLDGAVSCSASRVNLREFSPEKYGETQVIKRVRGKINLVSGGGISVKVKNGRRKIPHAFFVGNGLVAIRGMHAKKNNGLRFEAKKRVRFKGGFEFYKNDIQFLTGPSVSQAFGNDKIMQALELKAKDYLPKRLAHHLKRLTQ